MTTTTLRADAAAHPAGPPQPTDALTATWALIQVPPLGDTDGGLDLDESSEWGTR